jgi:hypothetical protein
MTTPELVWGPLNAGRSLGALLHNWAHEVSGNIQVTRVQNENFHLTLAGRREQKTMASQALGGKVKIIRNIHMELYQ